MDTTQQEAAAKADFVRRFVWNDASAAVLRNEHEGTCVSCEERPAEYRVHDYEDEASGGAPWCATCLQAFQEEASEMEPWVTQDPVGAWNGVGPAQGHGWSGLWFLFAAPGTYSKEGVWPYDHTRF